MARELAAQQAQLSQAGAEQKELRAKLDALLVAQRQWTAEREALRTKHEAEAEAVRRKYEAEAAELGAKYEGEAKKLRDRLAALTADNDALQAYQLQWAVEREEHLKAKEATASRQVEADQRLQSLEEEHENLKQLHAHVTDQTRNLASEWSTRRQTLTNENHRLQEELAQTSETLNLIRQREKQWQGQVFKLQDELRALRDDAGRMTLTDKQSHHLLSQLNAIIGFAEVLLDEAGNRATGEERAEFLHDIKESGANLADYVQKLVVVPAEGAEPAEPSSVQKSAAETATKSAAARSILVAATDPAVRERSQDFLGRAGYKVEFANDAGEAVKAALRLQPLAIMIDADLPPGGAEGLIELLQGEARARDIPVVLTVKGDEEHLGLTIGRFDFLTKPINRQQMLQMMVKFDLLADRRRATKMPTSVLVIDDDARNTRLVKAMLKPYNVNVLVADGGSAGIKLALKSKPDLIIVDLMMRDVDGFQVVSALRDDVATSQIPILIYTAKNITRADRERLKDSIQAIIPKGELSKEQFLELVYKRGERRNRTPGTGAAA
jgi:CheY-like chemotaxis protein